MTQTVYLDTETTGLNQDGTDEVLQVGIVDDDGLVLLNSYIKPTARTEWPAAQRIHGITPEMVVTAPTLAEILPAILEIVRGKNLVIYNASFDLGFLWRRHTCYTNSRTRMMRWQTVSRAAQYGGMSVMSMSSSACGA